MNMVKKLTTARLAELHRQHPKAGKLTAADIDDDMLYRILTDMVAHHRNSKIGGRKGSAVSESFDRLFDGREDFANELHKLVESIYPTRHR